MKCVNCKTQDLEYYTPDGDILYCDKCKSYWKYKEKI